MMSGMPLEGIKVLDFCEGAAGPLCAQTLGDFGADVIKVQSPRSTRAAANRAANAAPAADSGQNRFPDRRLPTYDVRNKRRIMLNLKEPDGLRIAFQLIATADVLVENSRPGVSERLGIGYPAVSAARPEVIYASMSGFGHTGPERGRRGTDRVLQAYAGPQSVTGEPNRRSVGIGPAVIDNQGGANLTIGVLLALVERQRSGAGQWVDSSLYDATVQLMSRDITHYTGTGVLPGKFGALFPYGAPYGNFFASDGEFFLGTQAGAGSTDPWQRLCAAAGWDDLAKDPRFASQGDRLAHRDELYEVIEPEFARRTVQEWLEIAEESGNLASRVNTVADVIEQEHAKARDMVVDTGFDGIKSAGIPIKLSRTPGVIRIPPHMPGEDTDSVLAELGYSPAEVTDFRARNVIG
jgi:crotonobetainyl-CoA:carnitine CoA-transferase CaiB-like acyl-CoA transferase